MLYKCHFVQSEATGWPHLNHTHTHKQCLGHNGTEGKDFMKENIWEEGQGAGCLLCTHVASIVGRVR